MMIKNPFGGGAPKPINCAQSYPQYKVFRFWNIIKFFDSENSTM